MTMENRIARPYARAAFALASESNAVAQWSAALEITAAVMAESAVQAWLKNPKTAKAEVVSFIVGLKPEAFEGQVRQFIELLAERGRLFVARGISELFEAYRAKAESYERISLLLAQPAQEERIESIKTALKKRLNLSVQVTAEVAPELIGGAVVKAGDIVIDGSVLGQLKKVADALEVV